MRIGTGPGTDHCRQTNNHLVAAVDI